MAIQGEPQNFQLYPANSASLPHLPSVSHNHVQVNQFDCLIPKSDFSLYVIFHYPLPESVFPMTFSREQIQAQVGLALTRCSLILWSKEVSLMSTLICKGNSPMTSQVPLFILKLSTKGVPFLAKS